MMNSGAKRGPATQWAGSLPLTTDYVDTNGDVLTSAEQQAASRQADPHKLDLLTYPHDHGLRKLVTYQPASRFWTSAEPRSAWGMSAGSEAATAARGGQGIAGDCRLTPGRDGIR